MNPTETRLNAVSLRLQELCAILEQALHFGLTNEVDHIKDLILAAHRDIDRILAEKEVA